MIERSALFAAVMGVFIGCCCAGDVPTVNGCRYPSGKYHVEATQVSSNDGCKAPAYEYLDMEFTPKGELIEPIPLIMTCTTSHSASCSSKIVCTSFTFNVAGSFNGTLDPDGGTGIMIFTGTYKGCVRATYFVGMTR